MRLPDAMKQERRHVRTEIGFGGLNRDENAGAGELSDCENLSAERFPALCPRRPRTLFSNVTDADDAYSFDGKLILCRGGKLYYDGAALCDVAAGKKKFVTVNTKLIVWPDKLLIDMTHTPPRVRKMDARVVTAGIGVTMTENAIAIPREPIAEGSVLPHSITLSGQTGHWFRVYTGLRWDETQGYTWDSAAWKEIGDGEILRVGDVLIPAESGGQQQAQVHTSGSYQTPPDAQDAFDAAGYYLTVTGKSGSISYGSGGRSGTVSLTFALHRCDVTNPDLRTLFRAGDAVSVSGHPISVNNKNDLFLTDVTEEKLTFAAERFTPCTRYATLGAISEAKPPVVAKDASHVYFFTWQHDGDEHRIAVKVGSTTAYRQARAGQMILVNETGQTPVLWLMEADETLHELVFSNAGYVSSDQTLLSTTNVGTLCLTIRRSMPELDDICEKDNRLWGVVNHQLNRVWDREAEVWKTFDSRLICASALGEPDDFFDYAGAYGGAYAVAVASEGDFTGVCAMDGDVLCWKEDRLYKVLGRYPADYQTVEFRIPGVLAGAHRTLAMGNGRLLYLGRGGIYSYDGGAPRLLSERLGNGNWVSGAAAWDGERALISLTDADEKSSLFVYDAAKDVWLREDDTKCTFCRHAGELLLLTETGKLLRRDAGTEKVAWQATLTPIRTEHGTRERGVRLILRAEPGPGSELAAYYRCDCGAWRLAGRLSGQTRGGLISVEPEPFERLDLRITGSGDCTLRGLSLINRVERA